MQFGEVGATSGYLPIHAAQMVAGEHTVDISVTDEQGDVVGTTSATFFVLPSGVGSKLCSEGLARELAAETPQPQ